MSDGIEFGGDAEVYAPAEDTYLLLKAALEEVKSTDRVLEMGCGRGIISHKLKPLACRVLATDINPNAVRMARSANIETIQTDLFRGIKARFDLIIFNPPYLPTTPEEKLGGWINRAYDGGTSGRDTINRFLEQARDHLNPKGRALLLVSSLSGLEAVIEKAQLEGLEADEIANEKYFFERLSVLRLTALKSR